MVALRDRFRAGDIWVEGSRAFRAFDDFLLPPAAFAAKRQAGELELAVPDRFDALRDERLETLERRLREVVTLASAGKLPEALLGSKSRYKPCTTSRSVMVSLILDGFVDWENFLRSVSL
jgi:hypothetical protein